MSWRASLSWSAASFVLAGAAAADLPPCRVREPQQTTHQALGASSVGEQELLARLVYAEARSTGFADDFRVHEGIAWGVMNRVRLAAVSPSSARAYGRGVAGVIFRPGQFNPAISARSPFSKDFLCPDRAPGWRSAWEASGLALRGGDNSLIQTPWEKSSNLSLVVNFYYPRSSQAKGPSAPWEDSASLRFVGEPSSSRLPPATAIRFYRLTRPPADIRADYR